MAIKTFNVDEEVYKQFAEYCKKHGISMSKRIENFIREELGKLKDKHVAKREVDRKLSSQQVHTFSKYC